MPEAHQHHQTWTPQRLITGTYTRETMAKIPLTMGTIIFRCPQVQRHDLIALASMFDGSFIGRLDDDFISFP
ncbi:hypothetical protein AB835_09445 [Candidatus Endobugula sertula]|uniref:Uncharacterized protein n=1 Tax=Candidatus Endobugula sertula TaxID=62101 RepID=A0A1D2QP53_9GAMM|nr:hypothetical protein AB835_09445 [Candidatus Endobugula sertula]